MKPILRFCLISTLRDKLFLSIFVFYFLSLVISMFFGYTTLSEQNETTIAYFAGSSRIIANLGMIVFICNHIYKLFLQKEIDYFLSKPVSRPKIISAYIITLGIISIIVSIIPTFIIISFMKPHFKGLLIWQISLSLEVILVSSFSFLVAMIFRNNTSSILSGMAFYVGSRMMGLFNMTAPYDYIYTGIDSLSKWLPQKIIYVVSVIMPRLDLFTNTRLLIYGIEKDGIGLGFILAQSILYLLLLIFVAFYDISRKEF